MVQNIGNTFDELMYKVRPKKIEVDLGALSGKAKIYYKGKKVNREFKDGKFIEKLGIGQAIFIEI
jgi:hypothetical protein